MFSSQGNNVTSTGCSQATHTHKNTWRDSLPIDMLLSAVSILVVAQLSLEVPERLMNYPVYIYILLLLN